MGVYLLMGILNFFMGDAEASGNLKVGDPAPIFQVKDHEGKDFDLNARKGKWTILYFYPKAETPGCTKQACAFRDSIQKIRQQDGDVFGVSSDDVKAVGEFHKHHRLNFTLLADPDLKVIDSYGVKMPVLSMSRRWTYVVGPDLKIQHIDKDVDPVQDADNMAKKIAELKGAAGR